MHASGVGSASVPIAVGVLCSSLYFLFDPATQRNHAVASALMGLGGTTIGLLVAALTLLVAGRGTRLISNLALTGHLRVLGQRIALSSAAWFACILSAFSALVLPDAGSAALVTFAIGLAAAAATETGWVVRQMIKVVTYWTPD